MYERSWSARRYIMKQLLLGNEAVARGLYEAGVRVVSSYPGTPSTEITEAAAKFEEIYCEWAPNEKVAAEVAAGASIAVAVWTGCAFNTLIYIAGLQSIDTDVYEAADLDGATGFRRFTKITFPLLAPSFTINMVLSAKGYLMVYDQIMAMTEGGPGTSTTSIAVLIYKKGFGGGQFAYQSANAVMLFIVVVLISVFQLRILEKREEKLG